MLAVFLFSYSASFSLFSSLSLLVVPVHLLSFSVFAVSPAPPFYLFYVCFSVSLPSSPVFVDVLFVWSMSVGERCICLGRSARFLFVAQR